VQNGFSFLVQILKKNCISGLELENLHAYIFSKKYGLFGLLKIETKPTLASCTPLITRNNNDQPLFLSHTYCQEIYYFKMMLSQLADLMQLV